MSSELRKKLIDRMDLYGLSKYTQKGYITAIKGLAEHYNRPPDKLTDDQVLNYFRHLTFYFGDGFPTNSIIAGITSEDNNGQAVAPEVGLEKAVKSFVNLTVVDPP